MNIEVLIATMNLKNEEEYNELIQSTKASSNTITINQITQENLPMLEKRDVRHNLFSFKERGLSKSRNKAISRATGDICIIADNDVEYFDNYEEIIKTAYANNPDADIIAFYMESTNPSRPVNRLSAGPVDYKRALKLCSVQITFKRESIINNNVQFNELFGAGAKYNAGEENIFLTNCLRKGLKIIVVDEQIGLVHQAQSTWFQGFDEKYFITKGACYYELAGENYMDLILDFANRKVELYKDNFTKDETIEIMKKGVQEYLNEKSKQTDKEE